MEDHERTDRAQTPSTSERELRRLGVLRTLDLVGSKRERAFDLLSAAVSTALDASIAGLSLVEADHLWFKSRLGFEFKESRHEPSFCRQVVGQDEVFWIADATKDARFSGHPLVAGEPHMRFYAGAPLHVHGERIGVLFAMDVKPRTFCQIQHDTLVALAACATERLADRAEKRATHFLMSDTSDAAIGANSRGQIVLWSNGAEAMLGFKREEVLGRHFSTLLPDAAMDDYVAHLATPALPLGKGLYEFEACRKDGSRVPVEAMITHWRDGAVTGYGAMLRDCTERNRANAALAAAKEEAESASVAKSEFLANMSHEIRTPLNGVLGVAGALAKTALDPAQTEMVSIIETSAKTLETLLSDILDLARVESGKMELRPEPFDLATSVNACAALFDAAAQAKGLDLTVLIVPDALGAYVGDAARIRQILSNLLGNAVKFTQRGGVSLHVTCARGETTSLLRFDVIDTGIGFDEETKARLFSRFEQADGSITRRFGGSGLGLSISRALTEAMGGRLDAEAVAGQGATFSLTVELERCAADFELWHEEDEPPEAILNPMLGLRVLLAEDHPINRRVVELILSAAGVNLACVENGVEAVAAVEAEPFDLILMDMQMPVMDGLTAIGEIRRRERAKGQTPTIIYVLTGNAMPEHVSASYAAGAHGHIPKPIVADNLLQIVASAATALGDADTVAA